MMVALYRGWTLLLKLGYRVAQLVETLLGFDSRWGDYNFSFTESFRPHGGPGVGKTLKEMSTRDISWGVKAAGV